MDTLSRETLTELLDERDPPCISLYQPTHRSHPENQQDPLRFRNLLKNIEASLRKHYETADARRLVARFHALAEDADFWNHTFDGLAVLAAQDAFRVFRLQRPVQELAVVADSFHVKPLLRILQSADRYQVLALSRDEVRLFEGNRDTLDELELSDEVPRTLTDALGEEVSEPRLTVSAYRSGAEGAGAYHGHGGRKDAVDNDRERFFRTIDRAIFEHHSRRSELPLILASLDEHHEVFHRVSHNPFLRAEGVRIDPGAVSTDELRRLAWRVVEPQYHARFAQLVEEFGLAHSRGLGSDDLAGAAQAAVAGRIAKLLVEDGRQIHGLLDRDTGEVQLLNTPAHAQADDLLDDLAETAIAMGGEVIVAPKDKMPTRTGIAAIYRF